MICIEEDDLSPEYLFAKSIKTNRELAQEVREAKNKHIDTVNRLKVLANNKLEEHQQQVIAWQNQSNSKIDSHLSSITTNNILNDGGTFNSSLMRNKALGPNFFSSGGPKPGGSKKETIVNPYDKNFQFKTEFNILKETGLYGCCSNNILRVNEITLNYPPKEKWYGIYNCLGIPKTDLFLSFYLRILDGHAALILPLGGMHMHKLWIDNKECPIHGNDLIKDTKWHHVKSKWSFTGGHNCIYPVGMRHGFSYMKFQIAAYKIALEAHYTPYSPYTSFYHYY